MTQKTSKATKSRKGKGSGNSVVRRNVLGTIQGPSNSSRMQITPISGGIRLKNQEVLRNVVAQSGAGRFTEAIAPHNFPWMKSMGGGFAHYKFRKLRIWYRPLQATTNPGIVYLGIFRDYSDANHWLAGGSGSDLLVSRESLAAPSWGGAGQLYFDVDCNVSRLNRYFTFTTSSVPSDKASDAYEYTLCIYQQDTSATGENHLGNLEIEYEIEFTTPVAPSFNV